MYFIGLFVLCWLWWWRKADKRRIPELYGAMVYTSFLGLATDLIMVHYKLWSYSGLPEPLYTVPLSLDFGIYPVVAYLFLQGLPDTWPAIFRRTLFWTAWSAVFEVLTLRLHYIMHHLWWNMWLSIGSDILIYMSIAAVYRYYSSVYVCKETESRKNLLP